MTDESEKKNENILSEDELEKVSGGHAAHEQVHSVQGVHQQGAHQQGAHQQGVHQQGAHEAFNARS